MVGKSKRGGTTKPSKRKAPVQLTGGSGFRFENSVAARVLLDMLSAKNSLGADFGRVARVDWQARDAGWLADDLAISCRLASDDERIAGVSVKSYQQLGRAGFHPDFSKIAWQQWLNENTGRHFRRGVDALVLVTGDIANDVRQAWSDLLHQASQSSPERVVARLVKDDQEGSQTSELQRAIFDSLCRPDELGGEQPGAVSDRVLLIRDLRVIKFDYEAQPSSDLAQALLDCQGCLSSGDASDAKNLWERLVGIADEKRPAGGSLDLPGLLAMLRGQFQFLLHPDFRAGWETLCRRSDDATADITGAINGSARLPRDDERTQIADSLAGDRVCLLVGESGSGKSALAKQIAADRYGRTVWLSADDMDHEAAVDFERAIGLRHPLIQLLLASPEPCLVVLDGAEAYSPDARHAAARIIKEIFSNPAANHVHVLTTVQFEAADRLIRQLAHLGVPDGALNAITLGRPSSDEVGALLSALPQLGWIGLRPEVRPLLANLKVLDLTARTLHSEKALGNRAFIGLTTLIDILWGDWVERGDEYGRSHLLKTIAIQEADQLSSGVARQSLGFAEQQALPDLIASGLVRVRDERVAFAHDLLGDWARMRVLVGDSPIALAASGQRAQAPRWHKAIRLFGQRILEQDVEGIDQWRAGVENIPDEPAPPALIRDLFLESLFLATNAVALLERTWAVLISSKGALLRRLLDRFLFVGTLPDTRLLAFTEDQDDAARFEHAFRVPYWPYWGPVLTILQAHREDVVQHAPYEAARVCGLWLRAMPFELVPGHAMPWRKEAAALAVAIAREIQTRNEEGSYSSAADRSVYEAALYAARDLPTEVGDLSLELAKRRELSATVSARVQETRRQRNEERQQPKKATRKSKAPPPPMSFSRGRLNPPWPDGPTERVDHEFQEACLSGNAFSTLARANPDAALEVLLAVCIEDPQHDDYGRSSRMEDTGLAYWRGGEPAMYFRGPFLQFLRVAPEQGISFVLRLVNFATRRLVGDRVGELVEIDGHAKRWLGDSRVFRFHHDWPLFHGSMIHSALMALEKWFYEQIEQGRDIEVEAAARRIVAESESVAFAGLMFDVGKRSPSLFAGALKPLFSAGVLWSWDFQLTLLRAGSQPDPIGFWGMQPQQLIALAQEWYRLPHRRHLLLGSDGAIPRTMLSKAAFRTFFEDVRNRWKAELDSGAASDDLRLLIERINPDNYTFPSEADQDQTIDFEWPEAIRRENDEHLRQIGLEQAITQFPYRCRKVLNAGTPLPADQLMPVFKWLQSLDTQPPTMPTADGEPVQRLENVILGGVAVLVVLHLDWLLEDPSRIAWCRSKLEAISNNPPEASQFDSEVAIGDHRWDDFAAECGLRLLAADRSDPLARKLVAEGIMAFHYGTTGLTMARAFAVRHQIGDDFGRLITLSVRWAALRVLKGISKDAGSEDKQKWDESKAALFQEFMDQKLAADLPDFKRINSETRTAYDALYEKRHPEFQSRRSNARRTSTFGGSREELYPDRLGLDERVLTAALAWLNPNHAQAPEERTRWLTLIHALLELVVQAVPVVDDPDNQEIKGLPSDFDGWVFQIVARAVPQLAAPENPQSLWQSIFDLGAPAHDWVERFFWFWFTDGLRAAKSPSDFVRIWRSMIIYAAASSRWNQSTYGSYRLDGMVIELLGLDGRWGALAADEAFSPVLATMVDVFGQAADLWFQMPTIVRNFLQFVVQPAGIHLLCPAIFWVLKAVAQFSSYDWRDGIEQGLVEFMRICWQRERTQILANSELQQAYFDLLAKLVSRGGHAAIALRDQIVESTA